MSEQLMIYRLSELTDPADPAYQLRIGQDIRVAAADDSERSLRQLATFEPGSVSVTHRTVLRQIARESGVWPELSVYLLGKARDEEAAESLALLLCSGPLQRIFRFCPIDEMPVDQDDLRAVCDVVRRGFVLEPVVSQEFNDRAMPAYPVIEPFEPRRGCGDQLLHLLDHLPCSAVIDRCFEPARLGELLRESTRYLADLQRVNQSWDTDEDGAYEPASSDRRWSVKPLRKKDPLVDEVLRRHRRLHEALLRPHLGFHIRVFAPTQALARLLASAVAEGCFSGGSYRLISTANGTPFFESAMRSLADIGVTPVAQCQLATYKE